METGLTVVLVCLAVLAFSIGRAWLVIQTFDDVLLHPHH